MKKCGWPVFFTAALLAFTLYITLDTFVFADTYQENATQKNMELFAKENEQALREEDGKIRQDADWQQNTLAQQEEPDYSDSNVSITMNEYTVNQTKVYVADVKLTSAQYLKTAFANDTYGKNVTAKTSSIADAHGAILAINGDYYGARESGYVIRNGIVYRDKAGKTDVLCIYADGSMRIADPSKVTAEELAKAGVWQAFSFGPALVENGEVQVSEGDEVGKAMASNPRTAIGFVDDLHYLFVVSDGRTAESEGLSLRELAEFMKELGAKTAYNLDGGGSSTMIFQGELINQPTTTGRRVTERSVSDIVYIG